MTKEINDYAAFVKKMLKEYKPRNRREGVVVAQILAAGAIAAPLQEIADRLEDLNINLVATGQALSNTFSEEREEILKALRRISADIPLAGKGW